MSEAGRRRSAFTQAEINRAVLAAKKAGAYAVEITPERITIILQGEKKPEKPVIKTPRPVM